MYKSVAKMVFILQSFPSLVQRPLMLNVTIEAENSKLKVCYSSDIGKTTAVRELSPTCCSENVTKRHSPKGAHSTNSVGKPVIKHDGYLGTRGK